MVVLSYGQAPSLRLGDLLVKGRPVRVLLSVRVSNLALYACTPTCQV